MSVGVSRVHDCVQTDSMKLMPLWNLGGGTVSCSCMTLYFNEEATADTRRLEM